MRRSMTILALAIVAGLTAAAPVTASADPLGGPPLSQPNSYGKG